MSEISSASGKIFVPPTGSLGDSSRLEWDSSGKYTLIASGGDDRIRVYEGKRPPGYIGIPEAPSRWLVIEVNQDKYEIPLDGQQQPAAKSITIKAGAGNDSVFVDPSVTFPLSIEGGSGNDYLKGGNGPNALIGGSGNDILIGGRSNDLLVGGPGYDTMQGNGGRDIFVRDCCWHLPWGGHLPPWAMPPSRRPVIRPLPLPPYRPPAEPTPLAAPQQAPSAPPPPPSQQRPVTPPRPPLSSLLSAVDTHDESGFKSGRDMTKNLLSALYEGPAALRKMLSSIRGAGERDDAVASFVRALLESSPIGGKMLRELPTDIKEKMLTYVGKGNAWSPNKKAIYLTMAKIVSPAYYDAIINGKGLRLNGVNLKTDARWAHEKDTLEFVRRYQGVIS